MGRYYILRRPDTRKTKRKADYFFHEGIKLPHYIFGQGKRISSKIYLPINRRGTFPSRWLEDCRHEC